MKFLPGLAAVCLLIAPAVLCGQGQISPNPNPEGNTITLNGSGWFNDVSFQNLGDLENKGTLHNSAAATLVNLGLMYNDGTLNNDGALTHNSDNGLMENRGTLTNGANGTLVCQQGEIENHSSGTLNNTGWVKNNDQFDNAGVFNNNGTVTNYSTGTFSTGGRDSSFINNGDFHNYGKVTNQSEFQTGGQASSFYNEVNGSFTNDSGTLTVRASQFSDDDTPGFINEGVLTNSSDGTININTRYLKEGGGGLLNNKGTLTNNGKINIAAEGILMSYGMLNNNGVISGGGLILAAGSTMNNNSGGSLHLTQNSYPNWFVGNAEMTGGQPVLNNYGTFLIDAHTDKTEQTPTLVFWGGALNNYGSLTNNSLVTISTPTSYTGTLTNESGGTLTNNGTIDTTNGTFTNHGTLKGDGKVIGNHSDYGATSPGEGAGVMTIDGDYFKVEGSMEIELGGLLDGGGDKSLTDFDWLDVYRQRRAGRCARCLPDRQLSATGRNVV
jgi:hypothetical protein